MADRLFTGFPFASSASGAVARTMPDRGVDVYNVKDFGAKGDAHFPYDGIGTDDTAAIQRAMDLALARTWGGMIFFPPGRYKVTQRLMTPTTQHHGLRFQGCGADVEAGTGSILVANMQDYILYVPHRYVGIGSIDGLGFYNANSIVPSSTEPPGIVEIDPNTGLPYVYTPDGGGCFYCTMGIGLQITNCAFKVNKGLCIWLEVQNSWIANCTFAGTYAVGQGVNDSFGVWCTNAALSSCKFKNLATAVDFGYDGGTFGVADDVVIENCGYGLRLGHTPLTYWFWSGNAGSINNSLNTNVVQQQGSFRNIRMRNCSVKFIEGGGLRNNTFENISMVSDGSFGSPTHAIGRVGYQNLFRNITASGSFSVGGIAQFGEDGGSVFENVKVTNSGGPIIVYDSFTHPVSTFIGCPGLDGAYTLAHHTLEDAFGQQTIATDNPDPEWTGTVSNAGKPLGRTLATNAALAAGTLPAVLGFAGSLPAWMAVSLPVAHASPNPVGGAIPPGTIVSSFVTGPPASVTLNKPVGYRLLYAGPTIMDIFLSVGTAVLKFAKPFPSWLTSGLVCENLTRPASFGASNSRTVASVNSARGAVVMTTPVGLTLTTTAATAAGGTVLTFPAGLPSWMANGLPVAYYGPMLPELTTVLSASYVSGNPTGTMTFSNPVRRPIPAGTLVVDRVAAAPTLNVAMSIGDSIATVNGHDSMLQLVGEEVILYLATTILAPDATVASFNSGAGTVTLTASTAPVRGAGVGSGDVIAFGTDKPLAGDEIIFFAGPGVASGDTIAFRVSDGGSNRVATRYNGFYWQIAGG